MELFHHSQSELYRKPFGAAPCAEKVKLRLQVVLEKHERLDNISLVMILPQGSTQHINMERLNDSFPVQSHLGKWGQAPGKSDSALRGSQDKMVYWYEAAITLPETPGLVRYYFFIQKDEGIQVFYGNNSEAFGGEGLAYREEPIPYQITVFHPETSTPHWLKEGVFYQIYVDRFYNGTEDGSVLSPRENSLIHASWSGSPVYVKDCDTGAVIKWDFFGGNLLGIIKKLPYLRDLGVTILYLNPVFDAPSNHKYDTGDYLNIDPMYGDNEVFQTLCKTAWEYGIRVILDGVFSHTGHDSIYFNKFGNYNSLGAYQSKESPYYSWYRFREHPHDYEAWWGIDDLPNVEEMEPSYRDFVIHNKDSVIKTWLRRGASGWRLDVADELPDAFIKEMRQTLKLVDKDSVLIGEVWEDASNKFSHGEQREYLMGEELDSVMNYPFRKALLDFTLGNIPASRLDNILMRLKENYPVHHFYTNMNLIGSHDRARILTLLGAPPSPEKMTISDQQNYRLPRGKREVALKRLKLLILWQMTFPGAPSIYYGDEVGMEGFADPFCRGPFPWEGMDTDLQAYYKKTINWRHQYPVLKTGGWLSLREDQSLSKPGLSDEDVYGYLRWISGGKDKFSRTHKNALALVLFNRNSKEAKEVELDLLTYFHFLSLSPSNLMALHDGGEFDVSQGTFNLKLPPLTGGLYMADI